MRNRETTCLWCQRLIKTRFNHALGTYVYANHHYAGSADACPGSGSVVPPEPIEVKSAN